MAKVYKLSNDYSGDYSHFIFYEYDGVTSFIQDSFMGFNPYIGSKIYDIIMSSSDTGKLNFKTDFSVDLGCLIFSEKAYKILEPFLKDAGQEILISHKSKRKKFIGIYPNKAQVSKDVLDLEWSDWEIIHGNKERNYFKDFIAINKPFLNETALTTGKELFTIKEANVFNVFVTDKFREVVESNDLKGFSFKKVVYNSDWNPNRSFNLIKNNLDDEKMGPIIKEAFNFYGSAEVFENFPYNKKIIDEYPFEVEYQKRLKEGTLDVMIPRKDYYRGVRHRLQEYYYFLVRNNVPIKMKYSHLML